MEYLSPEELKKNKEVIGKRLSNFTGPTIRYGFGARLFGKLVKDKNAVILDCGTASGGFLKDIANAGFNNLYGIDIDDYLVSENKKLLKEFKTADLSFEKMPWPDNFFDAVTAWCLAPHLENPHNFIREARRILKPGGLLIMSSINVASPTNRQYFLQHGDFPAYHERNNHITILTPAIFKKTVLKYFQLVGNEYFITPRIFDGLRGWLRKLVYGSVSFSGSLRNHLENRWGAKVVYILRKSNRESFDKFRIDYDYGEPVEPLAN